MCADRELVIWRVDGGDDGTLLHDGVAGMLCYDPGRLAVRLRVDPHGRGGRPPSASRRPGALVERNQHHIRC